MSSGLGPLTRQDLKIEIDRLKASLVQTTDPSQIEKATRIMSAHSQALRGNSNRYVDRETGREYTLTHGPLMGGGGHPSKMTYTLENAKNFDQAGREGLAMSSRSDIFGIKGADTTRTEEAVKLFQLGLKIKKKLAPNSLDIAESYYEIGKAYNSIFFPKPKYKQLALNFLQKALNLQQTLAPNSLAFARTSIEMAHASSDPQVTDIPLMEKGIRMYKSLEGGSEEELKSAYLLLARSYSQQKFSSIDSQLVNLHKALEIYTNLGDISLACNVYTIIKSVQTKNKQWAQALKTVEQHFYWSHEIANIYAANGQYEQLMIYYEHCCSPLLRAVYSKDAPSQNKVLSCSKYLSAWKDCCTTPEQNHMLLIHYEKCIQIAETILSQATRQKKTPSWHLEDTKYEKSYVKHLFEMCVAVHEISQQHGTPEQISFAGQRVCEVQKKLQSLEDVQ